MLEDGKTFVWRGQLFFVINWRKTSFSVAFSSNWCSIEASRSIEIRTMYFFAWGEFTEQFEKTKNKRVNVSPNLRSCHHHQIAVRSHRHFWRSYCYRTICLWISYRYHSMPVEWSCALHLVSSSSSWPEYVFASDPCAESSPSRSLRSHRHPHCLHPFPSLSTLPNRRSRIDYRVHTR